MCPSPVGPKEGGEGRRGGDREGERVGGSCKFQPKVNQGEGDEG